ncbi:GspE/PulE family protein [Novosphingobium sp.]|uniref:GspE/PulE family protein n=1 Tax=Novosphingobium sp. TaxID=1874826 RepID=UPI0025EFFF5B|nr:GspE/PulE family protein [Novosphingobium sp.]
MLGKAKLSAVAGGSPEATLTGSALSAAQDGANSIDSVLEARALLSREALSRARLVQQESGERIESVVTRLGLMSEQSLCEHLADASGMPMAPAEMLREPVALEQPVAADFLRDIRAVPIAIDDARVCVAVVDPFDLFVENAFRFLFKRRVDRVIARASDIDAAIERLCHDGTDAAVIEDTVESGDIDRMRDLTSDAPAIRTVNRLIAEAVDANASDIHVEPSDDSLTVRFRIDGMLRLVTRLPQAMRSSVVARIKVMAGLDIAERRIPQDGRLRLAVRGHEIDLRVATAPSIHGESAVLRILDRSNLKLEFAALGLDDRLVKQFREAIHLPYGIVLVTGPTGSGKTTTLYAALAELNQIERKLLTVEDPIEYRLPGIVQTQVQPGIGFTFATALRSFLRQDPDAIMVGEIRDVETAQIAVQAALTGHMILSTLHTNTAAGAITRLIDMEVEPFLLSSVLAGVLAQRLVRRLCMHCRVPFAPDEALLASLGIDATVGGENHFHRAAGCTACHGTGYSGRIALFDFLPVDDAIARLILKRVDARQIEECASAAGHRSLLQEGYAKAAQGLTTIEEVLRVASGE